MADFETAIEKLLKTEGGFAPRDNTAGAVNFGITGRFLKSLGLPSEPEDVKALTRADAKKLYRTHFWDALKLPDVRPQNVAENILFAAVNCGQGVAVRALQRALIALGKQYISVDGILGKRTILAINSCDEYAAKQLCEAYDQQVLAHYRMLAAKNPGEYAYDLKGWMARLKEV